jgi:hypothetical protein
MLLKPGWIIFLLFFWVITQLLITVDYAVVYNDSTSSLNSAYGAESGQIVGGLSGDNAPMRVLITTGLTFIRNPLTGIAAAGMNWQAIVNALWDVFTFQAPFLSGSWVLISALLTCVYAGFGLAFLVNFVQRVV